MPKNILSTREFKTNASKLLGRLREIPQPLVLTQNWRAKDAVHDYETYQLLTPLRTL